MSEGKKINKYTGDISLKGSSAHASAVALMKSGKIIIQKSDRGRGLHLLLSSVRQNKKKIDISHVQYFLTFPVHLSCA